MGAELYYYFTLTYPTNAISFGIKIILLVATVWMITSLFRATLIVPKAMDIKIKALLLTSLAPQICNLIIYFTPISRQMWALFDFLDFCSLNGFIYLQFEVLQIFRYLI